MTMKEFFKNRIDEEELEYAFEEPAYILNLEKYEGANNE